MSLPTQCKHFVHYLKGQRACQWSSSLVCRIWVCQRTPSCAFSTKKVTGRALQRSSWGEKKGQRNTCHRNRKNENSYYHKKCHVRLWINWQEVICLGENLPCHIYYQSILSRSRGELEFRCMSSLNFFNKVYKGNIRAVVEWAPTGRNTHWATGRISFSFLLCVILANTSI